jgi:hypothetical protein
MWGHLYNEINSLKISQKSLQTQILLKNLNRKNDLIKTHSNCLFNLFKAIE